ncbi:MAG: hypothetical protein ACLT5P_15265 [Flavonifractor plautii]
METGTGGVETAFRAEFRNGRAAPASVFCVNMTPWRAWATPAAAPMRGPAIVGAAKALKDCTRDRPFSVVVWRHPRGGDRPRQL